MSDVEYDFPVWGTPGDGLVRALGDGFVFVKAPEEARLGFKVGDRMPDEWDIVPANSHACKMWEDDGWWLDDGLDCMGDIDRDDVIPHELDDGED